MDDNLTRTNLVLTKPLRKALQHESNQKHGGKISMTIREILGKRYKMAYLLPHEIEAKR